jgi:hypothetical protein
VPLPSAADLARLRALAEDPADPETDQDCPDITREPGRFVESAPPYSVVRIARGTLAWFEAHGGNSELNRVLRQHIARSRRTRSPARRDRTARG